MSDRLGQWLARIEQLHPREIELGLERLRSVATRLRVATLPMPVITVAGTNGKGSVVALIRALAEYAGLRVCVYTSPHLQHFNERIRLPGGLADDDTLCAAFAAVDRARGDTALTYFEFTTLAGLWLFGQSGADLTILEVGLGGRLDAVNLIDAEVAVITSVGLDHTDWLGDSREQVLVEKLGIGRAGRPLVYGEQAVPVNLDTELAGLGVMPLRAGREFRLAGDGVDLWHAEGAPGRTPLPERVPLGRDNLATACQALAALGRPPTPEAAASAAGIGLVGRCQERTFHGVPCVLDVGHNLEALTRLVARLPAHDGQRRVVLGMMADKPVEAVATLLAGHAASFYLARPGLPRAAATERLAAALPAGVAARPFASVGEALDTAVMDSGAGDQVLIVGSFYTVAEALNHMENRPCS